MRHRRTAFTQARTPVTQTVTFLTNGYNYWNVPSGVTSLDRIQAWGPGGPGGDGPVFSNHGGGGGGGGYREIENYAVTPGQQIAVHVGLSQTGTDTFVENGATVVVLAACGEAGEDGGRFGGQGGQGGGHGGVSGSVGADGGGGGNGTTTTSGKGGDSGALYFGPPQPGGEGGAARTTNGNGNPGGNPGGGSGGARGNGYTGPPGGYGQVVITFTA